MNVLAHATCVPHHTHILTHGAPPTHVFTHLHTHAHTSVVAEQRTRAVASVHPTGRRSLGVRTLVPAARPPFQPWGPFIASLVRGPQGPSGGQSPCCEVAMRGLRVHMRVHTRTNVCALTMIVDWTAGEGREWAVCFPRATEARWPLHPRREGPRGPSPPGGRTRSRGSVSAGRPVGVDSTPSPLLGSPPVGGGCPQSVTEWGHEPGVWPELWCSLDGASLVPRDAGLAPEEPSSRVCLRR